MTARPPTCSRRDVLAALTGLLVLPQQAGAAQTFREDHFLFGSPVELLVRSTGPGRPSAVLAEVMGELARIHRDWNAWKPGEVFALNQALRRGQPARTTPELVALLREAARLEHASRGLFNAGIGGAVGAWGFHDDVLGPGPRPRPADVAPWRRHAPSLAQLEIAGLVVRSRNPYVQLDFGALAKGVAVDRSLELLRRRGQHDALVNLGGNLAAMGAPWHIGIRDPFDGGLLASVQTRQREAVVTSGSYERFRLLDGERITHILDPDSMAPAPELVSVTVVHPSAALADAAATALLVAGPRRWPAVAERMGVRQVLVVDHHGNGQASAALWPRLQFADGARRRRVAVA